MKRFKSFFAIAAALGCFVSATHATLLAPGGFVLPSPQVAGGAAASPVLASPYADGTLTGTILSQVFTGDPSNPFGPGFLSFYYRVSNVGGGAGLSVVSRLTVTGFAGQITDAAHVLGGGVAPGFVTRDAGLGDGIGVNFFPLTIPAPGISEWIVIHTRATTFGTASSSIIDSGFSDSGMSVFAPVPEPTTVLAGALLLLPFAASTLRMIRRKRTA